MNNNTDQKQKIAELKVLEAKLKREVDPDFFLEPHQFRTLPRVIDILGAQLLEADASGNGLGALNGMGINTNNNTPTNDAPLPSITDYKSHFDQLHKNNPAYTSLRKQQKAVEDGIEHLSLVHYKDLNASVVAVGQVSNRFGEAVGQVKGLRAQVQEIREHLANASVGSAVQHDRRNGNAGVMALEDDDHEHEQKQDQTRSRSRSSTHPIGGKSLRELWMKKLESEAVLSLLQKLQVIRETPGAFDILVHSQPCRIGAAVVLLSDAINTMFKDDVAQIQALNKITEQLMSRKQKAEEIVWETLQDVIYLRTGDYPVEEGQISALDNGNVFNPTSIHVVDLDKGHGHGMSTSGGSTKMSNMEGGAASKRRAARSMFQPSQRKHTYISSYNQRKTNDNESDYDVSDDDSNSMFSDDFSSKSGQNSIDKRTNSRLAKPNLRKNATTGSYFGASALEDPSANVFANFHNHQGQLLPKVMVESELELEADELRCLETFGNTAYSSFSNDGTLVLPRYNDPILGLRILIEALAQLGRLDDVERCISENLEREIRKIAELEQAKTLAKLEKHRNMAGASGHRRNAPVMGIDAADEKLKDFKTHLKSLLTSFGSVMLRLSHLAQILRHRITSDPTVVTPSYPTPSSALHSVLVAANVTMQREIKSFLHGCLNEDEKLESAFQTMRMVTPSMMGSLSNRSSRALASNGNTQGSEQGIFSLGIINDASLASSTRGKYSQHLSHASRSSVMRMSAEEYVIQVLCPRSGVVPQIRHALIFRKGLAAWSKEVADLKKELGFATQEDTSSPEYNATTEETSLAYLDKIIQKTLLPMMQDAAVDGTVSSLERPDAFEPITGVGIYNSSVKGKKLKVDMCAACQGLYASTGPLFSALSKLPRGGEMYSPLVAVLEHAILTFLSRVKQRVLDLCEGKKAFQLLEDKHSRRATKLSSDMESRGPFSLLWNSYFHEDSLDPNVDAPSGRSSINPIAPSSSDTKTKNLIDDDRSGRLPGNAAFDGGDPLQREQETFEQEVSHLLELLNFTDPRYGGLFKLSTEEEFLKAASLAHSLLKLASQLERRLKPKKSSWSKTLNAPRTLRDSIKNIRMHGLRLAKFCRMEVLLQTVQRMSTIYQSSSLTAKDAVRLPTSVNSLGEYLSSISDQMREYGGNKITAYALSSLEQHVPLFLMETARIIAVGEGLPSAFKMSLHGVESLDKCCSVLYRDLKSATGFENSFWDEAVAADAFDRAASYVALMELDMDELMSYWRNNRIEFTDDDYRIMFTMSGPNRKGDIQRFAALKERMG